MSLPCLNYFVAFSTPTITGIPRLSPTIAPWLVSPPSSVISPAHFSIAGIISRSDPFVTRIAPSVSCAKASSALFATTARPKALFYQFLVPVQEITDNMNFHKIRRSSFTNWNTSSNNNNIPMTNILMFDTFFD